MFSRIAPNGFRAKEAKIYFKSADEDFMAFARIKFSDYATKRDGTVCCAIAVFDVFAKTIELTAFRECLLLLTSRKFLLILNGFMLIASLVR